MNILITICARGGSKAVPLKNIKNLCGKPLIGYTIEQAKSIKKSFPIVNIALSTDSDLIRKVSKEHGLDYDYIRPEMLALDNSKKLDVIKDLIEFDEKNNNIEYDFIIDLDVTSPLRTIEDVKKGLDQLISNEAALNIFSVNRAKRNPYFNMVEKKKGAEFVSLVKTNFSTSNRQSAPEVFDMNASFYIYKRRFFKQKLDSAISHLSLIYEMKGICFDIDEPEDFLIMESLISSGLIKIETS
jgi:CMP-N,N'-diacetyllegionaminic acid synthase